MKERFSINKIKDDFCQNQMHLKPIESFLRLSLGKLQTQKDLLYCATTSNDALQFQLSRNR